MGDGPPSVNMTVLTFWLMENGSKVRLSMLPVIVLLKMSKVASVAPCTIGPQWMVA